MKKYFPFFVNYKRALILAPTLVIIDVVCEIVQPSLMSDIVDQGVMQKSMHYILQTGGLMIGLSLVAIAANIGNIYYSSHASVGFAAELRKGLFNKIQKFSFSNLDKFSSASLTTRITNDVNILQEIADLPNAVILKNIKGDVKFNLINFGYDAEKMVLKNISLEVKPGQKIALVGSTGAGKTTIANLLPRFYDIQSGQITIDGVDIKNIQRSSLRQSLAMVLQDTHLFTTTVMENIRYGKLNATDDEVIEAATLAGADSFIKRLPKGYETIIENDGGNLSQGQRQLLNIARATVAKPTILILDEATSSIDTRTEQIIQKGMDQLMQGRTSFVIAHRLSTVRNANEILVLENGEIIERGNHENLLKLKGRYFQLYTGQFD